ncbi:SusD family protein [bacterium A37T11]|nr:SusD family protein [bacterium A37T11]
MKKRIIIHYSFLLLALGACGKGFLAVKYDKSVVTPTTLADYQALLHGNMQTPSSHELGITGSDEFYLSNASWQSLVQPYLKNGYIWADDIYEQQPCEDYNRAYSRILTANIVLDGLDKLTPNEDEKQQWDQAKGAALYFRAEKFYQLAQLFCKPYYKETATIDPGIALRLSPDVEQASQRASVAETYQQICADLLAALPLLPVISQTNLHPSKAAANALFAKTYLLMGDYVSAAGYAADCLSQQNMLINYQTLSKDSNTPFPAYAEGNEEVILLSYTANIPIVASSRFNADTTLLALYQSGDLRNAIFYRTNTDGRILFKGSYAGSAYYFTGLSTSEVWLISAECHARLGQLGKAMNDINTLRKTRFSPEQYVPLEAADEQQALRLVLEERRLELVMRGTRWEDLRRLNNEPAFAKTLVRQVNDQRYELLPNSPRYVWPLPDDAINFGHLTQNPR